ncbi:hypothetical protein QOT17_001867 [Balamuthia mandrillaris]
MTHSLCFKLFILLGVSAVLWLGWAEAQRELVYSQERQQGNPLRGWMTYGGGKVSLEYSYFSMHTLMTGPNTFEWEELDGWIEDVAAKKRHVVFRVVVDYPGDPFYKAPTYLDLDYTDYTAYGDSGRYPDYTNEDFQDALVNFIAALGERYDGDQRIAAIKVGLLGYWGEWHMLEGFPSKALQEKVLQAFDDAFDTTHVLVSVDALERSSGEEIKNHQIGLHDDSYAGSTLQQSYPASVEQGTDQRWKELMFGGELTYEVGGDQDTFFNKASGLQKFLDTIEKMPVSWLLNEAIKDYGATALERAREAESRMGYQYYVRSVAALSNGIEVEVENRGSTPFYYEISLEASIDGGETVLTSSTEDSNELAFLQNGTSVVIFLPFEAAAGSSLDVTLALRSPMLLDGQKIFFANEEVEDDATLAVNGLEVSSETGDGGDGNDGGDGSGASCLCPVRFGF